LSLSATFGNFKPFLANLFRAEKRARRARSSPTQTAEHSAEKPGNATVNRAGCHIVENRIKNWDRQQSQKQTERLTAYDENAD
jgi:hypothetical protein